MNIPSDKTSIEPRPRRGRIQQRRRLLLLMLVLSSLVGWRVVNGLRRTVPAKAPKPWMTTEGAYQFLDGQTIELPKDEAEAAQPNSIPPLTLTLGRDRIESLKVTPGGESPDVEAAYLSFIVRIDQGIYDVFGFVSLHGFDGTYSPIVNHGRGWDVIPRNSKRD
ncbi:hypothetical protein [Singulisphaera sp. PoT]|uniref:hypothetical protein n=1 Tax=Singulisphaera sp. PoT TaxID=3411797 RepID=UPI003BF4B359